MYTFANKSVSGGDDIDEMVTKLALFGVSITQYQRVIQLEEIGPAS